MDINHKTPVQGAIVVSGLHFLMSLYLLYKKSSKGEEDWKWCVLSLVLLLVISMLLINDYMKQKNDVQKST